MDYEMEYHKLPEGTNSCRNCGQILSSDAKFCPICGTAVAQRPQFHTNRIPYGTTKKEYRKRYAPEKMYKDLKIMAIVGYVMVGINVVLGLLVDASALVDALLQFALVFGVHKYKSKGCAIGMLVYSIINMLFYLALNGKVGGWGWLALAIGVLSLFRKMDQQYQQDVSGAEII